jgi:hypothetical protein
MVEQVKGADVGAGRDLDQLGKAVADLRSRQSAEEAKVQERLHRRVIGAEAVLVVAVVDGDLDADARIDQPNDRRRDPNVVRVAAVCGAGEPARIGCQIVRYELGDLPVATWGGGVLPSNISDQSATNNKNALL